MHPHACTSTKHEVSSARLRVVALACACFVASAQSDSAVAQPGGDPFAGVTTATPSPPAPPPSWAERLFSENFGWRWELMLQVSAIDKDSLASRQSVGFELLKKFSSETKTFAAFNLQGRLVRRDGFVGTQNDAEGAMRRGFFFEYHNAYLDLYNPLDPMLSERRQSENVGRYNLRVGRFYVPFGLSTATDTHATILQLSNERNFGSERDWGAGLWGALGRLFRYDAYYLVGSGYDLDFGGQGGLAVGRIGLANVFLSDYGAEGGLSFAYGNRLDPMATERSPSLLLRSAGKGQVRTRRIGVDARYRHAVPSGLLTVTYELSSGTDASALVLTQLYQAEYLHASRRFGFATQLRSFLQEVASDANLARTKPRKPTDASLFAEATWYFSNDPSGSKLHWLKLNGELQLQRQRGPANAIGTLQYYLFF